MTNGERRGQDRGVAYCQYIDVTHIKQGLQGLSAKTRNYLNNWEIFCEFKE